MDNGGAALAFSFTWIGGDKLRALNNGGHHKGSGTAEGGRNKTVGDGIVGSPSPHHTPHLTTRDMMGGPSIDATFGTASSRPTTRSTTYIEMVGDPSFGGSTSTHPILHPTTCTRIGGRSVLNVP
ncbi:unnamed protein product [Citrullus colocynthis]|uniref:Uncharacterized protein n=1 Tax=Citrullus colocynthis TaxID=252529 RepID=A0ABP0YXR7_9ROSI